MLGTFIPYQSYQLNNNFSFIHLLHITAHPLLVVSCSVISWQATRKWSQPRVVFPSIYLISLSHTFLPSLLLSLPFSSSPSSQLPQIVECLGGKCWAKAWSKISWLQRGLAFSSIFRALEHGVIVCLHTCLGTVAQRWNTEGQTVSCFLFK